MATKYSVNYDYLETIDTPTKAQILGTLFADGCIYPKKNAVRLSLIEDDKSYLQNINDAFSSNKILYCDNRKGTRFYAEHSKTYNIKNSFTLVFCNKKLMNDCVNLGMCPNKTYTDPAFPSIDRSLYAAFILGLFEGDGCLTITSNPSKTTTKRYHQNAFYLLTQEKFALKIIDIFKTELGIDCKFSMHKKCSNCLYRICIKRIDDTIKLYHYLYKDAQFVMMRKHDKFSILMNIFKIKGYEIGEIYQFDSNGKRKYL